MQREGKSHEPKAVANRRRQARENTCARNHKWHEIYLRHAQAYLHCLKINDKTLLQKIAFLPVINDMTLFEK